MKIPALRGVLRGVLRACFFTALRAFSQRCVLFKPTSYDQASLSSLLAPLLESPCPT